MREPPPISVERLQTCLREQYDIVAASVDYLPRGADYHAGVFRVVSEEDSVYLLKATARPRYEPSFLVPRYLHELGLDTVVAPLRTKSAALWASLDAWTVILYPFLDGDTNFTGMTRDQWQQTGSIFRRIHHVQLAPEALAGLALLREETFDTTVYTTWLRDFEAQYLHKQQHSSDAARALCDQWMAQQSIIHTGTTALTTLAEALRSRVLPSVICHADLHPANLLRDRAGRVFVLDWDEVMLAPKERDFIFVWEGEAAADAFWEGYGERAVDWVALTYFRWERVIQDLIENARDVCCRDDLGEQSKAGIVQRFAATFTPGGTLDAAYAAAAHLPSDAGASIPTDT